VGRQRTYDNIVNVKYVTHYSGVVQLIQHQICSSKVPRENLLIGTEEGWPVALSSVTEIYRNCVLGRILFNFQVKMRGFMHFYGKKKTIILVAKNWDQGGELIDPAGG